MITVAPFRARIAWPFALSLLSFSSASPVLAAANDNAPPSKIYVAELVGDSTIGVGGRIEAITKKAAYSAEGACVETKRDACGSLVFSNGTAIHLGPETRIEIITFSQAPFLEHRTDLDAEPSASETCVKIDRGSVGICTAKLVPGSSQTYQTPHATVIVRGRKLMIEVTDAETRVSLIEGDIAVSALAIGSARQALRPGQQAIVRQSAPARPVALSVQPIMDEQQATLDENISLACVARRTVFFEVVHGRDCGGDEIRPIEVAPAAPDPGFTVSPARIGG